MKTFTELDVNPLGHQPGDRVNAMPRLGDKLRFSMAEVRISASTDELCDRLTQGFPRIESPADPSLRNLAG